ncbi:MAG: DUF362 domain-containing protein [Pseudanabaenaceae cyanobacterium]|jgi:uncharacterized protein (DUF362 family)
MKPIVSLRQAHSYDYAALLPLMREVLEPLGGMTSIVKPGDRVLLKPNLLTGARPTKECTTRPEIVYCVAKLVQEAGGKPFLGDSPAFGSVKGVAEANGLLAVAEELDLPLVEFHGDRYATGGALQHLRLSKEAMGADVVINLPKVKSHMQLTVTLGVKNLFGCVPGKMKAWWHMEAGKDPQRFAQMLIETAQTINPQLTIIDGIIGHEGNGPSGGEPRHLGVLGASRDVFALDRAVLAILQVDPEIVPIAKEMMAQGLCGELTDLTWVGDPLESWQMNDWRLPDSIMPIDFGLPRVVRSTFKHLYIKLIKEPMAAYART